MSASEFVQHISKTASDWYSRLWTFVIVCALFAWTFLKKHENAEPKMTRAEEDRLIEQYEPEDLVEEVPEDSVELRPRIVCGKAGEYVEVDGIKCVNFATHNYLGLVGDERIEKEAIDCIGKFGVGSCGPRGFYGTTTVHMLLEERLARFLGTEESIIYSYGFSALASAIPAYAKKGDVVFVDEKCNFAIQQGLVASQSRVVRFTHNDVADLQRKMEALREDRESPGRERSRWYLVVEGIYVNTGRICPLPEVVRVCKQHKVRLFLDESVSVGVLGRTGRGAAEHFSVARQDLDLTLGSFEHALGTVGGFGAGARLLTYHQQMAGTAYCFSASAPPLLAAAAVAALQAIVDGPELLSRLKRACNAVHARLNDSRAICEWFYISGDPDSPIHLLAPKDQSRGCTVDEVVRFCQSKNVAVVKAAFLKGDSAMDSPSLRITTSVTSEKHLYQLIHVLEEACAEVFQ